MFMAEVTAGARPGPRIYTAGTGFSHPEGQPPGAIINPPVAAEEARHQVRALAAQPSRLDPLKLPSGRPIPRRGELQAVVAVARDKPCLTQFAQPRSSRRCPFSDPLDKLCRRYRVRVLAVK